MIDQTATTDRQTVGQQAEQLACQFLQQRGWNLLRRNYFCRRGELDLIMTKDKWLIFVEVRWRRSPRYGSALESVTASKQQKLITTAEHFLQNHPAVKTQTMRFDVISVGPGANHQSEIVWIQDAFQA